MTSGQHQTQRTLCEWLRVEYGIERANHKLLALTELDSNTCVSEVKRIRGKKQPLSSAGVQALRGEYTHTMEPGRGLAAETLTLEDAPTGECRIQNLECRPLVPFPGHDVLSCEILWPGGLSHPHVRMSRRMNAPKMLKHILLAGVPVLCLGTWQPPPPKRSA